MHVIVLIERKKMSHTATFCDDSIMSYEPIMFSPKNKELFFVTRVIVLIEKNSISHLTTFYDHSIMSYEPIMFSPKSKK